MVPAANLIGFAGQELGRKLPKVIGVLIETTLCSIVEIILFMVLLKTSKGNSNVPVIRAAILGSILANLLLCLGACFIAGGFKRHEQSFHAAISEAGSGLILVAGSMFLSYTIIPSHTNVYQWVWSFLPFFRMLWPMIRPLVT
jgi:Ca2+:H+ antiporter